MKIRPTGFLAAWVVLAFLSPVSGEEPKVKASADWPQFMGPARNGVVEGGPKLLQTWPKEGPKLVWTSDALPKAPLCGMGMPVVYDGKVYTYAHVHVLMDGIKPFNKELLEAAGASKSFVPADLEWMTSMQEKEVKTHKEFMLLFHAKYGSSGMYHTGRAVVLNAHAAKVYKDQKYGDVLICLDAATGKELWRQTCPGALVENAYEIGCSGTPAVADGKVFLRGSGGLHCLDAKDGKVLWHVKGPAGHSSPVVANGSVYCYVLGDIPTAGRATPATLAAFDAQTGRELWQQPKARNGFQTPALWINAGKTYVLGADSYKSGDSSTRIYCLESATGKIVWEAPAEGGKSSPVVSGDIMVLRSGGCAAYALSPDKAEQLWITPGTGNNNAGTSPVISNGHVYCVGLSYGTAVVKVYDLKSGKLTMEQNTLGGTVATPAVADGLVFSVVGGKENAGLIAFKTTPDKYEEVGRGRAGECAYACSTVALANGRLYVRLKEAMACYDVSEAGK